MLCVAFLYGNNANTNIKLYNLKNNFYNYLKISYCVKFLCFSLTENTEKALIDKILIKKFQIPICQHQFGIWNLIPIAIVMEFKTKSYFKVLAFFAF
jgi:hypothetical protein